jgi:hypothetical protein
METTLTHQALPGTISSAGGEGASARSRGARCNFDNAYLSRAHNEMSHRSAQQIPLIFDSGGASDGRRRRFPLFAAALFDLAGLRRRASSKREGGFRDAAAAKLLSVRAAFE